MNIPIFAGDTIRIRLETNLTLTGYTLRIKFRRPDGRTGYWTGTIDPSDSSKLYYDTDTSDLDIPGEWVVQALAYSGGVLRYHGQFAPFQVLDPMPETSTPPTTTAPTTLATTAAPTTAP